MRIAAADKLALFSSSTYEWYTPPALLDKAREVVGDFHTDPASCDAANELVRAKVFYSHENQGEHQVWKGPVWANFPGGTDEIGRSRQQVWAELAVSKWAKNEFEEGLFLLKCDPTKAWSHVWLNRPHCVLSGRIVFQDGSTGSRTGSSPHAYVVMYLGHNVQKFACVFSTIGSVPGYNSWAYTTQVSHHRDT